MQLDPAAGEAKAQAHFVAAQRFGGVAAVLLAQRGGDVERAYQQARGCIGAGGDAIDAVAPGFGKKPEVRDVWARASVWNRTSPFALVTHIG
ncbi:hypothetical protein [Novosphingobium sp. BW1]|uniref:hypothetical protein n=1 Tax=Novosphingobium sp. BW1 TaxID=2592621 RepID=UPI001396AEFF|nr:hypothetical protein [Novosphingobium sp. BW1]